MAVALAPSCFTVAASGVGVLVSQQFIENAQVTIYERSAADLWAELRAPLVELASDGQPILDDSARTAEFSVEGGKAAVRVEATAPRRCRMLVGARKMGVTNADLARFVSVKLDNALDRTASGRR